MEAVTDRDLEKLRRDAPLPLIAARIRRARKDLGLSHDDFVARTEGLYRPNLIGYEKGKHRPTLATIQKIAEASGKDARWFVDPELDPSPFQDERKAA